MRNFQLFTAALSTEPSDKKALFSPVAGSNRYPKIFLLLVMQLLSEQLQPIFASPASPPAQKSAPR
jgi:hypothetical protein